MDIALIALVTAVLLQTSFLTYKQLNRADASKNEVLLDTSVLIDGRILAIARSGLLTAQLVIPRSVVRELQFMADKADHDKRERARFGLEMIEKLQQLPGVKAVVRDDGTISEHGVDEQLIVLAQKTGAKLCTIDYNLNKAARVQSVEVVNINEMAHALRVIHLPGETIQVQLLQPGQDKKQAVGYLDDGTMVVVDDSRDLIGQSVEVEVTRMLQTAAGRMAFARRKGAAREQQRSGEQKSAKVATAKSAAPKAAASKESVVADARKKPARRQTRRTRKTPEDKLVDLANK